MSLQWVGLNLGTFAAAAGLGAAAVVAFFALRRILGWLLGPIFVYETLRLARKGHTFWLRVAFALLMLGLLYAAKPAPQPVSPEAIQRLYSRAKTEADLNEAQRSPEQALMRDELVRFAAEFSESFLLVLAIAVTLITPLYFATTISEEKEKRTLDFLLGTRLSNWDIVIGKYTARLLNLFGVLLAALPILALTQFWGGVDWADLLEGLGAIVVATLTYSCASVALSASTARTRTAVIGAYAAVFVLHWPGLWASSPVYFRYILRDLRDDISRGYPTVVGPAGAWAIFVGVHVGVSLFFLILASVSLRAFARRHAGRRRRAFASHSAEQPLVPHPLTIAPNPPLRGDPLVWKERYIGRTVGGWFLGSTFWAYAYLILALILILMIVIWVDGLAGEFPEFAMAMRVLSVLLGSLVLVTTALRMAAAVSREREQQTMVSLLTLPIAPRRILRAKWLGTWLRARIALGGAGLAFLISAVLNDIPWYSLLLLPLTFGAQLWFYGNFGLFLSVVCRSTNRAYSLLMAALMILVAGSWTVSYFEARSNSDRYAGGYRDRYEHDRVWLNDHTGSDLDDFLSPPQSWWRLTSAHRYFTVSPYDFYDLTKSDSEVIGLVPWIKHFLAAFAYFGLGTLLRTMSSTIFRREGARA